MPDFRSKKECEDYSIHNKLAFFQKDINQNFAKLYVAETYENIYNKISSGDNNYYESWGSSQTLKLYLDYDRKVITTSDSNENGDLNVNHKAEILNIINNKVLTLL
jgi:hypothetical protein